MAGGDPYLLGAAAASCWFLLLTIANLLYLRATRRVALVDDGPHVTVIVPARNEETNIGACLESLLNQTYRSYDIIVVNDNSEDRTAEIAGRLAGGCARLTVVNGRPVPAKWNGKQYACEQAVRIARGELLLLTDADVRHAPTSIARAVAQLKRRNASFLSGFVRQEIGSLGEAVIVPMTYMMSTMLLPLAMLSTRLFPHWSFAIGQYMLIRRETLERVGGYESLRDSVVEDVALGRAVRGAGERMVFVDARESATCRMYRGYHAAFRGFTKSVFGAVGGKVWVIALLAVAIWLAVIRPWFLLAGGIASQGLAYNPAIVPVLLFTITWTLALHDRGIRSALGLLYPFAFANLVIIGVVSAVRTGFGKGVLWKGRLVRCGRPDYPDPDILNAVTLYRFASTVVYSIVFAAVVVYNRLVFGLCVHGRHNLREVDGGFFLISNHTLYLDPGIIAHAIFPKRTYFSAMAATFERPFIGPFIRLLGAFPLPERLCIQRITPAIEWALRRGRCVHFFPEGELTHRSQEPAAFQNGVFYLAARFDVPVVPVTLVLEDRYIMGVALPRPFVRVTVVIGRPIYADQFSRDASRLPESTGRSPKAIARAMASEAHDRVMRSIESITR